MADIICLTETAATTTTISSCSCQIERKENEYPTTNVCYSRKPLGINLSRPQMRKKSLRPPFIWIWNMYIAGKYPKILPPPTIINKHNFIIVLPGTNTSAYMHTNTTFFFASQLTPCYYYLGFKTRGQPSRDEQSDLQLAGTSRPRTSGMQAEASQVCQSPTVM